jgi:hypothetical protein
LDGIVSAKLAPVPATFLTKRTLLPIGVYNVLTKGTFDFFEFFLVLFLLPPLLGTYELFSMFLPLLLLILLV